MDDPGVSSCTIPDPPDPEAFPTPAPPRSCRLRSLCSHSLEEGAQSNRGTVPGGIHVPGLDKGRLESLKLRRLRRVGADTACTATPQSRSPLRDPVVPMGGAGTTNTSCSSSEVPAKAVPLWLLPLQYPVQGCRGASLEFTFALYFPPVKVWAHLRSYRNNK